MKRNNKLNGRTSLARAAWSAIGCLIFLLSALPCTALDKGPGLGNIVQNAGFESGAVGWSLPAAGAERDTASAHRGAASLKYSNTNAQTYRVINQRLTVQAGDVLDCTLWLKGDALIAANADKGAGFYIECWDSNDAYVGGSYPDCSDGTFDWKELTASYTIPAGATTVNLGLYFRQGTTGTAWFDDIRITLHGPNVLNNGGFENGTDSWNVPSGAELDLAIRHGAAASLRYTNTTAATYQVITQNLPVRPGNILNYSGWVKGDNIVSANADKGAGIYIEAWGAAGNYIAGFYPTCPAGTFDWRELSGSYIVPPGTTTLTFGLYLRQGSTGTAWFDDIQVRVPPFQVFFTYPNYRGTVKTNDTKPWQANLQTYAHGIGQLNPLSLQHTLFDSSGAALQQVTAQGAQQTGIESVTFNPVRPLSAGNYHWQIALTPPSGAVQYFELPVRVVTELPSVHIDDEGYTVVDGQRFFPLGLYLHPADNADLARIAAAKFNTVLSYNYGFGDAPAAYLDRVQQHGLKAIYSVKDMYAGLPEVPGTDEELLADAATRINNLKNKPAVLAWYINDELGPEHLPRIQRMYDVVRANDSEHPAYQVLYQVLNLGQYLDSADVIGTDPYPVGSANLAATSSNARMTAAAVRSTKGVWMVPQAMDHAVYNANAPTRPPSLDEMRNQAYQAVIGGARGLIFYSYFDLWYANSQRQASQAAFDARWPDVSAMSTEIQGLIPAILHGKERPVAINGTSTMVVRALEYNTQLLLFVANPYYTTNAITVTIPTGWTIAQAQQGQIQGTLTGQTLTLSTASIGSGVFYLKKD